MKENKKPRIELISWMPVALWSPDLKTDLCAICRNLIMDTCVACQHGDASEIEGGCTIALGECEHAFHSHCINRWLKTKPVCPLDSKKWVYAQENDL